MENPIKMDDLGVPPFSETSIWMSTGLLLPWYPGCQPLLSTGQVVYIQKPSVLERWELGQAWVEEDQGGTKRTPKKPMALEDSCKAFFDALLVKPSCRPCCGVENRSEAIFGNSGKTRAVSPQHNLKLLLGVVSGLQWPYKWDKAYFQARLPASHYWFCTLGRWHLTSCLTDFTPWKIQDIDEANEADLLEQNEMKQVEIMDFGGWKSTQQI